MEFQTYGKSKPPEMQKVREDILAILNHKVKGELPWVRATDLRTRVCSKVKAPSFFDLLKEMESDELLMISGVDTTWAQCAVWHHPRLIEWRIEREKLAKEWEARDKRDAEEKRKWEIENAPRLARERFTKELGEFFADNSDELFAVIRQIIRDYSRKRKTLQRSRSLF